MTTAPYPAELSLDAGPVSAVDLALYAAASGDHNPIHLDVEAARAAGFDRPIVHGMLTMAYAARPFTNAFGPASLRRLEVRFTGVAKLGDTVRIAATLESVDQGGARYVLRAQAASDGREVAVGHALVLASGRSASATNDDRQARER